MSLQSDPQIPNAQSPDVLQGLDDIVGFHLRLAHGAVYRNFSEKFADLGLTQKQVSVLWLVNDHPAIGQARLGRILQMDRATVMAIINRLAKRNFIIRKASKTDKRRQTLHMTDEGLAMFKRARLAISEHENWLKNKFSKKEVTQLIALLRRIHE